LSNPDQRLAYNYSIGISRYAVVQAPSYLNRPAAERSQHEKSNAYLDPTDRPLSPGELFALFILGVTFVGCLILVVAIGWSKGEIVLHPVTVETAQFEQVTPSPVKSPALSDEAPAAAVPNAPAPAIPSSPSAAPSHPLKRLPSDNLSSKII
jgi:hypothetical protein